MDASGRFADNRREKIGRRKPKRETELAVTEQHQDRPVPDPELPEGGVSQECSNELEAGLNPDDELEERFTRPVLQGEQGIDKAQVWIAAFLIVVVGLMAFWNVLAVPFHVEDLRIIVGNQPVHSIATFPGGTDVPGAPGLFALFTFALNWMLTPDNAAAFHGVNVLLHILNGVLLFLVARRFLGCERPEGERTPEPIAMLAGLLFLLHPATTESVAYVVGRAALLSTGLSLLSTLLFLRATHGEGQLRAGSLAVSLVTYVMAVASHPVAIVLPAVLGAADLVLRGRKIVCGAALVHIIYWGLLVLLVVSAFAARLPGSLPSAVNVSPLSRCASGLVRSLVLTVSPGGLSPVHVPSGEVGLAGYAALAGLLVLLLAAAILVCKRSALGFAAAWYSLGLASVDVALYSGKPFTERLLYFPLPGAALVLPWLIAAGLKQPKARVAGGIAIALVLITAGVVTFMRNGVWQSPERLWGDAVVKAPRAAEPRRNLADVYLRRAREELAEMHAYAEENQAAGIAQHRENAVGWFGHAAEQLQEAVQLDPDDSQAWVLYGEALEYVEKPEEAIEALENALRHDMTSFDSTVRLAELLYARAMTSWRRDDLVRSAEYFARAERLDTLQGTGLVEYVNLMISLGNLEEAERILLDAGAAGGQSPLKEQWKSLHMALARLDDLEKRASERLRKDPSDKEALLMNCQALMGRGRLMQAMVLLNRLLRSSSPPPSAWEMMGVVKARMDGASDFIEDWSLAAPLGSQVQNPWRRLAGACAAAGLWDAARTYLESDAARASGVGQPLLELAETARQLGQEQLRGQLLEEATEAYPADYEPWVLLCERALDAKNAPLARRLFDGAAQRGAPPEVLDALRGKLGVQPKSAESVPTVR